MSQKDSQTQPDLHAIFCGKVGIEKDNTSHAVKGGFYKEVLRKYKRETYRYWFIASTIHTLYLLQIILGATATAVSASKVPTTALTILTAIVTVVAGMLAFITGHGHPGRAPPAPEQPPRGLRLYPIHGNGIPGPSAMRPNYGKGNGRSGKGNERSGKAL
jgi:SMODS and SLOG-associating 2TM effector domain